MHKSVREQKYEYPIPLLAAASETHNNETKNEAINEKKQKSEREKERQQNNRNKSETATNHNNTTHNDNGTTNNKQKTTKNKKKHTQRNQPEQNKHKDKARQQQCAGSTGGHLFSEFDRRSPSDPIPHRVTERHKQNTKDTQPTKEPTRDHHKQQTKTNRNNTTAK